jgi:cyanophycin synthetase
MQEDGRTQEVETILDELEATRHALDMGADGDVIVVCVDHPNEVWKELQRRQHGGGTGGATTMAAVTMLTEDGEMEVEA